MQYHDEWARRQWEAGLTEDWHYEYLLMHLRAKLVTMERYNRHLSYVRNGPYYADQIKKAIAMVDIILEKGGMNDYGIEKGFSYVPESFRHHVNMRNRKRITRPNDGGLSFWSDAQRLRFDKAWMLLWRFLSEKMMLWGD